MTTGHSNSSLSKGLRGTAPGTDAPNQDASGLFRWYNDYELTEAYEQKTLTVRPYNDYELPPAYRGQTVTVRLHGNGEDASRKFNRTENVRPIAAGDPDFKKLYARRSDSESINRGLEYSLYLKGAHSVGHARQHVNLLGYALMVNLLTLHQHRRRMKLAEAA